MSRLTSAVKSRLRGWRRCLRPVPSRPAWLQVEINNTCTLRCVMCPREALKRLSRLMTVDEFRDIASKAAAAGVPKLRLFLLGEPLLHPDLLPMIRLARGSGIPEVTLNTNAALLTPDLSDALLRSGLTEIVFSLDGATAATYEAIRRGARYDAVTANVEHICRLAQTGPEPRPRLIIQTMVMADTQEEIAPFLARWEPLADEVDVQVVREYQGVGGLTPIPRRLPGDELRPCPALWEYLVILADGTVTPCCADINGEMKLGNIEDIADLGAFWRESPALTDLRRTHCLLGFGKLPLCRDCDFVNVSLTHRKAEAAARPHA